MSSSDEIKVSQILFCDNGATVVVMCKTEERIIVKYRNALYERPISIIGDKLHVECPLSSAVNSRGSIVNNTNDTNLTKNKEDNALTFSTQALIKEIIFDVKEETPKINPNGTTYTRREYKERSDEGMKVLGRNISCTGPRPGTVSGYTQEYRKPIISKKRKRR